MSGFEGERLYLHPVHPGLCDGADNRCKPTAYVISGDRLSISESCADWTFAEYRDKKAISGWVGTDRLRSNRSNSTYVPVDTARHAPISTQPACLRAERLLNNALISDEKRRDILSVFQSALEHSENLDKVPDRVGPQDNQVWAVSSADVVIRGQRLKALSYESGGTCHDGNLELWTPDFSERVPVPGSNSGGAQDGGYSSETMVVLDGIPIFMHTTRSAHSVVLVGFNKNLMGVPLCTISQEDARRESVRISKEPEVCDAVLAGKVQGAPIDDVEPFSLNPESFRFGIRRQDSEQVFDGRMTLTGRGLLDIDNDGQIDDVGMVAYENGTDSAGCGHDVDTVIPIKLNPDGMPLPNSDFNRKMIEQAGSGEDARLFTFHGKTYYETRAHSGADGLPWHSVARLTATGPVTICEFEPIQYRAVDAK